MEAAELLNTPLLTVGGASLTPARIMFAIGLLVGGFIVARWVRRLIERRVSKAGVASEMMQLIGRVTFYTLVAVFVLSAIGVLGIPLTAFAFVSGAIAIGVGFGAQNIINNFISGWILMGERPIRTGDFVEVQGAFGVVEQIHNRYTRIRRTDGVHMLVPNSWVLENTVVNWTLVDRNIRTSVTVGVEYGSDVERVRDIIFDIVTSHPECLKTPEPKVFFQDFGDNALLFEAFFWSEAGGERDLRQVRSDVRFTIESRFREEGVVVAFPQRDVHLDGTVTLASSSEPAVEGRGGVSA